MRPSTSYYVRVLLADHFELFMTAFAVFLSSIVTLSSATANHKSMALTFLVWLLGVLTWAVHRHGCLRQRGLIEKLCNMLQDRINNRLTVLSFDHGADPNWDSAVVAAARIMTQELDHMTLKSLRQWERRNVRFLEFAHKVSLN